MNKKSENFRKTIAEEFIDVLESEPLTWHKGWNNLQGVPFNGSSGHHYKGINRFKLQMISRLRGYDDPRFYTFKQIAKENWKMIDAKGKGIPVEYWFMVDKKTHKGISWQNYYQLEPEEKEQYVLRSTITYVFNARHIDGIKSYEKNVAIRDDITLLNTIQKASQNMKIEIYELGNNDRAYYSPNSDIIVMPPKDSFESMYEYSSTLLHEMAHSTMHSSRLDRKEAYVFNYSEQSYAIEELRAEISSCFMSNEFGIEMSEKNMENHLAYVQSWVSQIREKPETLIYAIKDANKIANYIEYNAELLNEKEYIQTLNDSFEINETINKEREEIEIEI